MTFPQGETLPQIPHEGYNLDLHFHPSVTELEICEEIHQEWLDWETESELAAERRVEEYFENQGYWEARLQEEEEARRGVVQFEDAMADAQADREYAVRMGIDANGRF